MSETPLPEAPSPATSAEKPGLFAGLTEDEARKLWTQGQTLAALSLAQQNEAATDGR